MMAGLPSDRPGCAHVYGMHVRQRRQPPNPELQGSGPGLSMVPLPGFNNSDEELRGLAEFLVSVSPFIPWHVTAFHKDYKMDDPDNTRPEDLLRAGSENDCYRPRQLYALNWCPPGGRVANSRGEPALSGLQMGQDDHLYQPLVLGMRGEPRCCL